MAWVQTPRIHKGFAIPRAGLVGEDRGGRITPNLAAVSPRKLLQVLCPLFDVSRAERCLPG